MSGIRSIMLAWAMAVLAPVAAAQAPMYFPADNFGDANKSFPESANNQDVLEVLMGPESVFESVADLATDDTYRRAGRSVALLDLLIEANGKRFNTTCTATLIAPDRLLTNHHCVPGVGHTVLQAQARFGFLDRQDNLGQLYVVNRAPIETSKALDYTILSVQGVPTSLYPPAKVSVRRPKANESLFLVHHPAGQPQMLTRFKCRAGTPVADAAGTMIHHCDTLGGSSGTMIFANGDGAFVGLHYAGVIDRVKPFNKAKFADLLLNASAELRRLLTPATPKPTSTVVLKPLPTQPPAPAPSKPSGGGTDFTAVSSLLKDICATPPPPAVVYFAIDRADLTADAQANLQSFATRLLKSGCVPTSVIVSGHTDTSGSALYNQALSARMAQTVASQLTALGVDARVISTQAAGETNLAKATADGVREPLNRRVEISAAWTTPAGVSGR